MQTISQHTINQHTNPFDTAAPVTFDGLTRHHMCSRNNTLEKTELVPHSTAQLTNSTLPPCSRHSTVPININLLAQKCGNLTWGSKIHFDQNRKIDQTQSFRNGTLCIVRADSHTQSVVANPCASRYCQRRGIERPCSPAANDCASGPLGHR